MKKESTLHKILKSAKNNWFTYLMVIFVVVIIAVPNAKSWVLRQLMVTGVFNAKIEDSKAAEEITSPTDFVVKDVYGDPLSISSLRGKVVFINFWASWCPPCIAEFPSIASLYGKFKNNPNIVFIMINEDTDLSVGIDFLKKHNYTLPFFTRIGNVPEEVFSGSLPTTIVLDKNGIIRMNHQGVAKYDSENFIRQIEQLISEK